MTEFIQVGSSGQDFSVIHQSEEERKQTHWRTVWLTDWLQGHVASQTDQWKTPETSHLSGLHFPTVCLPMNATEYQTRWIRKVFGHVKDTAHYRFVLPGGHEKLNSSFFYQIPSELLLSDRETDYILPSRQTVNSWWMTDYFLDCCRSHVALYKVRRKSVHLWWEVLDLY